MLRLRDLHPKLRRFVLRHILLLAIVLALPCTLYFLSVGVYNIVSAPLWLPLVYFWVAIAFSMGFSAHQYRKRKDLQQLSTELAPTQSRRHKMLAIKEILYFAVWIAACGIGTPVLVFSLLVLSWQVPNGSVSVGIAIFAVSVAASLAICTALYIYAKRRLGREWQQLA